MSGKTLNKERKKKFILGVKREGIYYVLYWWKKKKTRRIRNCWLYFARLRRHCHFPIGREYSRGGIQRQMLTSGAIHG
jgi:hypothetical protein